MCLLIFFFEKCWIATISFIDHLLVENRKIRWVIVCSAVNFTYTLSIHRLASEFSILKIIKASHMRILRNLSRLDMVILTASGLFSTLHQIKTFRDKGALRKKCIPLSYLNRSALYILNTCFLKRTESFSSEVIGCFSHLALVFLLHLLIRTTNCALNHLCWDQLPHFLVYFAEPLLCQSNFTDKFCDISSCCRCINRRSVNPGRGYNS